MPSVYNKAQPYVIDLGDGQRHMFYGYSIEYSLYEYWIAVDTACEGRIGLLCSFNFPVTLYDWELGWDATCRGCIKANPEIERRRNIKART